MKEKLLTIILFLIFMLPVGMADNIFMPTTRCLTISSKP